MQNILFYGNCQTTALKNTLNLKNINITNILCHENDLNEEEFKNIIQISDIIIMQNICDNYREKHYLSTKYIINNCKKDCKILIFDSCYFNFYYFDLTYKKINNEIIHLPNDYHYNKMIECYMNNISADDYINNYVNNQNLFSSEELEQIANDSIYELYNRNLANIEKYKPYKNIHVISCVHYIKYNYKDKLLFYSMNHPTKFVIQFICEKIINILQIPNTINYDIDLLNNPKCILYKCVGKNVNFDINNTASILGITDINKIVQLYYNTYKEFGFK